MNSEFLSMNGEAGVVLQRILAEDKCNVLVRGEDGEEDGFCKTCNCWVDLSRFYNIDGYYQPCKDCYVCDDDLTYSDTDDEDDEEEEDEDEEDQSKCKLCKRDKRYGCDCPVYCFQCKQCWRPSQICYHHCKVAVWLEMQACTNEDPCHDYDECSWCCQHVKPCECGCGFLGGTCNEYHERLLMEAEDVNV